MKILEEIGLTRTESKVYLTLLQLGQTTTTAIIRDSGVHASKVYEFLDRLVKKGLASYVVKSNKKYFSAADPSALRSFLEEKKRMINEQDKEISKIIPELRNMQGASPISGEIYEGLRGIKTVYEKVLQEGQTQYIIGAPRIGNERIEGFLLEWHRRRIRKKIRCKYIYDSNVRDYGNVREKMTFTQVRYLPKHISPMWIEVFGEYVSINHIKHHDAIVFLLRDKEIAKGYLQYFDILWKLSDQSF